VFIRRTATRRKRSGGSCHTFRLVRSFRTPDGVRQETLPDLGADFRVPRKQWPELVAIVEDLVHRRDSLFDPDSVLHGIACRIHARIADRVSAEPAGDLATVHLDSLDHERLRSVGDERIALRALRDLGFAGKGAIHPKQIPALNAVFTPDAAQIERARRILRTFEEADTGLVVIDGKLIEKPVLRDMHRILAIAERVSVRA